MAKSKPTKDYIFKYKSPEGHYVADAFVVRCVDNRFWKSYKRFMRHLGFKHVDPKSPAGGAKVFVSPFHKGDGEFYLRELELSIKLHQVKRVMLFTHHDCGAYGGFSKFDNDSNKELKFHQADHKKAAKIIKSRFPGLKVETYFMDNVGIIQTS